MSAYGGTSKFDGTSLGMRLWTGTTVVRDVKREIDRIVDIKPVAPFTSERKMSQVTLIWTKVQ